MQLAQDFLQYLAKYALDNLHGRFCSFNKRARKKRPSRKEQQRIEQIDRLKFVTENDFQRLSYTEAANWRAQRPTRRKKNFNIWLINGVPICNPEHERYLVEKHFKKPVILYNYPAAIVILHEQNDDGKTVRAMDVLFPGIGEIIGGSQREELR